VADVWNVNRFWEDAASIFETATAVQDMGDSEIAILIDDCRGMRIIDAAGWDVNALRREYQASTAYTVKRSNGSVTVEAENESDRCMLKKRTSNSALTNLTGYIPHHLVRPEATASLVPFNHVRGVLISGALQ
jgi:hypothetical protein